jgi:hypothetical protein
MTGHEREGSTDERMLAGSLAIELRGADPVENDRAGAYSWDGTGMGDQIFELS